MSFTLDTLIVNGNNNGPLSGTLAVINKKTGSRVQFNMKLTTDEMSFVDAILNRVVQEELS